MNHTVDITGLLPDTTYEFVLIPFYNSQPSQDHYFKAKTKTPISTKPALTTKISTTTTSTIKTTTKITTKLTTKMTTITSTVKITKTAGETLEPQKEISNEVKGVKNYSLKIFKGAKQMNRVP